MFIEWLSAVTQTVLHYTPDNSAPAVGEYERLNEVGQETQPECPFYKCSAIQNLFQVYASGLLRKSFKQKVSCDDFWQLEERFFMLEYFYNSRNLVTKQHTFAS